MSLQPGDKAPDFTMPTDGNGTVTLAGLRGKPVVLYFYPKDDTSGCTKEACEIRDAWQKFKDTGAVVLGVSTDDNPSHVAFAEKYKLPFALLSDHDHAIAKLYGADGLLFAKRMTYVIDPSGKIAWVNPSVNPSTHSAELQAVLAKLQ